jgi:hypothetical protein
MFELGMRLAFDKATVIIKDDKTEYSFDTGVIEHVGYPRDLRFGKIVDFKKSLADKVAATYRASVASPDHSVFLKNFGKFEVASLSETEVPATTLLLSTLQEVQDSLGALQRRVDVGVPRHHAIGADDRLLESMTRILGSITKYRVLEDISDTTRLAMSQKLYEFVQSDVDAPRYFSGPQEFRSTLEALVKVAGRVHKARTA